MNESIAPRFTVYQFLLDHRVGGPHVRIRTVAARLPEYETLIVTPGHGPETDIALVNLRRFWRPLYALEMPLNALLLTRRFFRTRRGNRRGAAAGERGVVFHVNGAANIAPLIAARMLRLPVLWHFNDTLGPNSLTRLGFRMIGGLPHRLAASSDDAARAYGLKDYALLRAPVDLDYWNRSGRAGGAAPAAVTRILHVGNLNPLKGQDLLLDALEIASAGCAPFPFHVTFIGEELASHRAYAENLRRHPMAVHVKFAGRKSRDEIRAALADCDLFVLPSRSEACPVALIEAAAMECCCVAFDVGGVRDILGESGGIVVRSGDVSALAAALRGAATMNPGARESLAINAGKRVNEAFSANTAAEIHRRLYDELSQMR